MEVLLDVLGVWLLLKQPVSVICSCICAYVNQNLHKSLKGILIISYNPQAMSMVLNIVSGHGVQHFYDFLSSTFPVLYVLFGYNAVYVTQI